jgi:hypothetical protein
VNSSWVGKGLYFCVSEPYSAELCLRSDLRQRRKIGSGRFTPKKIQYPLHRRLCGPRNRSGLQEISPFQRHSIPRSSRTYRMRYRDRIVFWYTLDKCLSLNFKVLKAILIMQFTFLNWIVGKIIIPKFLRILPFEKQRSSLIFVENIPLC